MATYLIDIARDADGALMTLEFGEPGQNDELVRSAEARLDELKSSKRLAGGPLLKINGSASLPIMAVIIHAVVHLFESIAIFDPKLGKYVVSVSHGKRYNVGDLI